jgi:rhodanese-related sulfurtransferase
MKKILLILIVLLQTYLSANFIGLTPTQVEEKLAKNIKVIDIRTPSEWKETGIIPNSYKMMFFTANGKYDTQKWLNDFSKIIKDQNEPFILVCAHANRSNMVGKFLSSEVKYKNVYELKGGIVRWLKENKKTIK